MRDHVLAFRMKADRPEYAVLLTVDFAKEPAEAGEVWTATCLELGTSAYAQSIEEARDQLQEAVQLQLNEVERLGFMEEYLEERCGS